MTESRQPVYVEKLPAGYRWATSSETETASHSGDFSRMVQVRKGGTDDDPWTDLAVPLNYEWAEQK